MAQLLSRLLPDLGTATIAHSENRMNFASFGRFKKDAQNGRLPNYAFIEPKYFSFLGQARSFQNLGDRPLIVVTAAQDAQAGWLPLQDRLAGLSTSSSHRRALHSYRARHRSDGR